MKNKLIILLCLAILAMTVFASCENFAGNNGDGECQHPVSEEWTTNETNHWHATTCEHGEFRTAYGEHADANEDGFCDACAYEVGHEHTYSSEWSNDLAGHWHNATCTHTAETGDFGLHADSDADGKCDSCGAHVHVINSASGKCDVCGVQVKPVDTSNLSSVIAAISGGYSNINGGQILYQYGGSSNSAYYSNSSSIVDYAFGENCTYIKIATSSDVYSTDKDGNPYYADNVSVTEKWHELRDDGSIFGAYRESADGVVGELAEDGSANENTLYGYYYSVSTLAHGYGAEGVLADLYAKSQEKTASDFSVIHEEGSKTYKFSYNATIVQTTSTTVGIVTNVNYFEVEVEFTYDENYSLTNLSIVCDCYTNDAGANPDGTANTDDADFTYDAATGKVTMSEKAKADTYTFTVTQTVGERTFVNEYNKEYFAPKGFLVYSDVECTTLCPDTVTVSLSGDKYARFYLQDSDGMKFTSATAEELEWTTSDESGLSANWPIVGSAFSFSDSSVRFLAKKAGTYTATFTYQGVTKTFTVVVTA